MYFDLSLKASTARFNIDLTRSLVNRLISRFRKKERKRKRIRQIYNLNLKRKENNFTEQNFFDREEYEREKDGLLIRKEISFNIFFFIFFFLLPSLSRIIESALARFFTILHSSHTSRYLYEKNEENNDHRYRKTWKNTIWPTFLWKCESFEIFRATGFLMRLASGIKGWMFYQSDIKTMATMAYQGNVAPAR